MFKLGVTGGIGSGKSTICKIFKVLGIPYFSADDSARDIMNTDSSIIEELNNIAGINLYKSGTLDRQGLAEMIFNDNELLLKVNETVHPYVIKAFIDWSEKQLSPYVILEAAILFESGGSSYVDRSVAVIASQEERIMRVLSRSKTSREDVIARIRNQLSDRELAERADLVINNSENTLVIPQVLTIHNDLLSLIKIKTDGQV